VIFDFGFRFDDLISMKRKEERKVIVCSVVPPDAFSSHHDLAQGMQIRENKRASTINHFALPAPPEEDEHTHDKAEGDFDIKLNV
jgi:hypothetical protein